MKEENINLADDDVVFTLLTENTIKTNETLANESDGDEPSANTFNPVFLKIQTISFKKGRMVIEFKDSDKK